MSWSIEHVIWWLIVLSWAPWPELPVTTRFVSVVIAIPAVSAVTSLIVVFFIPCGYLAVGAVVVVIAGSLPLVVVSVWHVIFGWSSSLVLIRILSICESVCYIHEFCHYFRLYPTNLLDKISSMESLREGIDCPFVRDFYCKKIYDTPPLYVWAERFIILLGASFDFFDWRWPLVSRIEFASELFCEFVLASNCLPA
jgi:hypothetical protein